MNFFEQLANACKGKTDITLRIMQKNDKLTIDVKPGSHSSTTQPMVFTGTPAELDAEFFTTVFPAVEEVKGILSNIDDVKKQAEEKANAKQRVQNAEKNLEKKKKADKEKKSKNPVAKEASMFEQDQPGGEEEATSQEDDNSDEDVTA